MCRKSILLCCCSCRDAVAESVKTKNAAGMRSCFSIDNCHKFFNDSVMNSACLDITVILAVYTVYCCWWIEHM